METYTDINLGFSTADAEDVKLRYEGGNLVLSFRDWREEVKEVRFLDTLGFRWQEFDEKNLRDDTSYEVLNSLWLEKQAKIQVANAEEYAHYKLCFNTCGVLDVLARKYKSLG